MYPNFIEQVEKKNKTAVVGSFGGTLLAVFFAGWILFLVYAAVRPDSWPYIGLWSAFGISYLFSYVVNRLRGV